LLNLKYIIPNAKALFEELKNENYLFETSVDEFAQRAAYYMAELNILHPFRDGNGRAIREFIRCLALKAGYEIKWNSISKDELLDASIKSVTNIKPLKKCIKKAIDS
jgi:cell filamentation protein